MNVETVMSRIRGEFEEMPGLVLTMAPATRFFGLDPDTTPPAIDRLLRTSYLRLTRDGSLTRASS